MAAPVSSNSYACDPACLWRSGARDASPRRRHRDLKRSSQKLSTLRSRMSTGSSLPARFQSTAPSFAPSTFSTSSSESLPSRSGSQTPLPVSAGAESLTDAKAARELGGARRAAHRCPSRQRACLHSAGCTQPFSRSALTTSHTALTTWQPCPSMCGTGEGKDERRTRDEVDPEPEIFFGLHVALGNLFKQAHVELVSVGLPQNIQCQPAECPMPAK